MAKPVYSAAPQERICPKYPHKRRYATEKEARNALALAQFKHDHCGIQRRRETRTFACEHCGGHHLTSEGFDYQQANDRVLAQGAVPGERPDAQWVHCVDLRNREVGQLFGWMDKRSQTGWLCGFIIRIDHGALRVRVHDITAAVIEVKRT